MAYELKLDEGLPAKLDAYINSRFHRPEAQLEAIDAIESVFLAIADNPQGSGTTTPGPYTGLKAVVEIEVDGTKYYLQVAYRITEDEEAVEILTVRPQPF